MATVTGMTAARMLDIEQNAVVDGSIVGDDLILEKQSGTTINAGNVRGPVGPPGSPAAILPITKLASIVNAAVWTWFTPAGAVADGGGHIGADVFEIRDADLARSGKTTHIRARITAFAGGSAPGQAFTCRCYSFTQSGAGSPVFTRNVQQGGNIVVNNPAGGGRAVTEVDLGVIVDGWYGIAVTPAAALSTPALLIAQIDAIYV
jgi:hypothetical protein